MFAQIGQKEQIALRGLLDEALMGGQGDKESTRLEELILGKGPRITTQLTPINDKQTGEGLEVLEVEAISHIGGEGGNKHGRSSDREGDSLQEGV